MQETHSSLYTYSSRRKTKSEAIYGPTQAKSPTPGKMQADPYHSTPPYDTHTYTYCIGALSVFLLEQFSGEVCPVERSFLSHLGRTPPRETATEKKNQ